MAKKTKPISENPSAVCLNLMDPVAGLWKLGPGSSCPWVARCFTGMHCITTPRETSHTWGLQARVRVVLFRFGSGSCGVDCDVLFCRKDSTGFRPRKFPEGFHLRKLRVRVGVGSIQPIIPLLLDTFSKYQRRCTEGGSGRLCVRLTKSAQRQQLQLVRNGTRSNSKQIQTMNLEKEHHASQSYNWGWQKGIEINNPKEPLTSELPTPGLWQLFAARGFVIRGWTSTALAFHHGTATYLSVSRLTNHQ